MKKSDSGSKDLKPVNCLVKLFHDNWEWGNFFSIDWYNKQKSEGNKFWDSKISDEAFLWTFTIKRWQ